MEAIREGAEDYETFAILRSRVAELERDGVRSTLLSQAKAFLDAGPAKVVETMRQGSERWTVPKQRSTMDTVRMRALDLLCRLSRR
jgi:hypothetical protein